MEVVGRVLIHVSLEPVTFFAGVGALWLHKQLQATEIGHTALHGAWDGLPGRRAVRSRRRSAGTRPSTRSRGAAATTSATTSTPTSPARIPTSTSARCGSPSTRRTRGAIASQLPFALLLAFPNFALRHEPALHRPQRRLRRQRPRPRSSTSSRDRSRAERHATRTRGRCARRPLLPQELRLLPLLAGPGLLEGAARQLARRDAARSLLGGDDLLRPRRRDVRPTPRARAPTAAARGTRCRSRRPTTSR